MYHAHGVLFTAGEYCYGAEGGIFFSLTQQPTGLLLPKLPPLASPLELVFKSLPTKKKHPNGCFFFGAEGGI